ncbi:MAG: AraC family transcriptional regulator [Oscillospiraceae bacterium]|nr:AraC family transcriptional regulator [Oscillospiraceae bacterium]
MALSVCGPVPTDKQGRELVEHGTPLFPVACYHDNVSQAYVPWHWHDELEILVVETGTARVSVNGTDHLVKRGEGFFVNAGALHGVWSEGEETCLMRSVVFHPRLVGGSVDSIIWQKYLEPLLSDPCRPCVHFVNAQEWEQAASAAIQAAWQSYVSEAVGFEFDVREWLSRLVFLLVKNCPTIEKKPPEKTLRDGERVKAMLQYIQEHYGGELTLAKIAESASVSENECLRCFRSMIGSTPIQYVKQLRVQKAAELLVSTNRKISDIGAECGFQEMSYFAKTFRELKGCTPGDFRKFNLHLFGNS